MFDAAAYYETTMSENINTNVCLECGASVTTYPLGNLRRHTNWHESMRENV